MARPLRIEYEGALYHITSRGDRQEAIYETDEDRERFLAILGRITDRFNWVCYAYCLMTNHYHLLIETPDSNLSKGINTRTPITFSHPPKSGVICASTTRRYTFKEEGHHPSEKGPRELGHDPVLSLHLPLCAPRVPVR